MAAGRLSGLLAGLVLGLTLWVPAPADLLPDEARLLGSLNVDNVLRDTRVLSEEVVDNDSGAGPGSAAAGSEAERRLADWMAGRLADLGLQVERQRFPVRAFDYGPVTLEVAGERYPAITFHSGGGTWGSREGRPYRHGNAGDGKVLAAPLVDLGDGLRADYERAGEVAGRVVLARWTMWPGFIIREAAARGAAAIILHDYPGRSLPDALKQNTVIGRDAIPAVHVSIQSAQRLQSRLAAGAVTVRLENRVDSSLGESENVVATLAGREHPQEWLLVGAHHDRWFRGAQDNAVGGALLLELGRALTAGGPLRRSLALVSFGAEETGGVDTEYDWLTGSHAFVRANPGLVGRVAYGFNVDGAGWSAERGYLHASPELLRFQGAVLDDLDLAGRVELRRGVTNAVDAWTLGVNGGASIAYLLWFEGHALDTGASNPYSQYYHTQHDLLRPEWYGNLRHDLELGALSLARMDAAEALPLDLAGWGAWIVAELARLQGLAPGPAEPFASALAAATGFRDAAQALEESGGAANPGRLAARRALSPWLYSLSYTGAALRPAPQVDDLAALDAALAALQRGDAPAAAAALAHTGTLGWGRWLSPAAYAAERLAAHSAPDWAQEYGQSPEPPAPDLHAIYLELEAGRIEPHHHVRLAAMRAAALEHLRADLFVLEGRLRRASALLVAAGAP